VDGAFFVASVSVAVLAIQRLFDWVVRVDCQAERA
jgi:hypothetical protein